MREYTVTLTATFNIDAQDEERAIAAVAESLPFTDLNGSAELRCENASTTVEL